MAAGLTSGLDRHVHAPAHPPGAQVRDELEVDLGRGHRGRRWGLAVPPGPGWARGLRGAAGWPSRSGRAARAVGVSVGVGVGVGFCAASSSERRSAATARPAPNSMTRTVATASSVRRERSRRPPAATNNRSPSSSNGSRALRASGSRLTSAETPIWRGRRRVLVVAQHAPVDRDALGLGQAGERLGQVGAAAFADRGQRRFTEQERLHADARARGVRHLAAPLGVGDDVAGGAQQPRDRRALARLVLAAVLVRPRERLPQQVEQHVRLPRPAPEVRGDGPHVAFVELAERLRVVAPQQLSVRPHVSSSTWPRALLTPFARSGRTSACPSRGPESRASRGRRPA